MSPVRFLITCQQHGRTHRSEEVLFGEVAESLVISTAIKLAQSQLYQTMPGLYQDVRVLPSGLNLVSQTEISELLMLARRNPRF